MYDGKGWRVVTWADTKGRRRTSRTRMDVIVVMKV